MKGKKDKGGKFKYLGYVMQRNDEDRIRKAAVATSVREGKRRFGGDWRRDLAV